MRAKLENKGKMRPLIDRLKKDYKMSQRDIARWCGVNYSVVNLWYNDKIIPISAHLDKIMEAFVLLAGRNIRYKHQALDILQGEE